MATDLNHLWPLKISESQQDMDKWTGWGLTLLPQKSAIPVISQDASSEWNFKIISSLRNSFLCFLSFIFVFLYFTILVECFFLCWFEDAIQNNLESWVKTRSKLKDLKTGALFPWRLLKAGLANWLIITICRLYCSFSPKHIKLHSMWQATPGSKHIFLQNLFQLV